MSRATPLVPGFALAASLALAACHRAPDAPGAVTADEQRQLNDAAATLDAAAGPANGTSADDNDDNDADDNKADPT